MNYRHELKFEASDLTLEKLRYRLLPLMRTDAHQDAQGYTVRSLYFDDPFDRCMRENEAGTENRSKYRIRIYNGNTDGIHLERKCKYRGLARKTSCIISEDACRRLMSGCAYAPSAEASEAERRLAAEILSLGLQPRCIVEYDRFAFVEPVGNVRVTFDRNICGSRQTERFLDASVSVVPVMPRGRHILEVKYDELLPEHLLRALNIGQLQWQSFSKYYCVRTITG